MDAVCQRLEPVADASGIALVQDTGPVIVFGLPRLLDEMIYNLTNNAIRYNRENGSVNLYCGTDDEGRPYVRVQDTGIVGLTVMQDYLSRFDTFSPADITWN